MCRSIIQSMCLLLLTFVPASTAEAQESLKGLLQAAKYDYLPTETEGVIRIPIEIQGDVIMLYGFERTLWEKTEFESVLYGFYVRVMELPAMFKPTVQFLTKVSTINEDIMIGRLSISSSTVWYNTTMWAKNATADLLNKECFLAYASRSYAKKELDPFIQEGK